MSQGESATDGIGTRLRRLLAFKGETIKSLSDRTGIPYRTLHNHVGGSAKPNADQMALLVEAGIDANYLLTGKNNPQTSMVRRSLPDDIDYTILADNQVLDAINNRAKNIVDTLLSAATQSRSPITFDEVLGHYTICIQRLTTLVMKSEPFLAEARKKGAPLEAFIGPVLDVAMDVFKEDMLRLLNTSGAAIKADASSPDKPVRKIKSSR